MTHMNIKLNDLSAQWKEIKEEALPEIIDYLDSGQYVHSNYVSRFEAAWSSYSDNLYSTMVSSGTAAYQVALEALEFDPVKTCVLLQNNTWASILFTTKRLGYGYDYIDCDEYLQYSTDALENWLKENRNLFKDVVLVPTHILGHPCDMASITTIAEKYSCYIIEDCSQAHGASCRAGNVGQFSHIAFWSLYPGKNLGGVSEAGVVSTNISAYKKTIDSLINCGMSEKHNFISEGFNFRPCGVSAIALYHKLKKLDEWNNKRVSVAKQYSKVFEDRKSSYCRKHVYHYYPIFVKDRETIVNRLSIPYSINYPFTLSSLENNYGQYSNSMRYSKEMICLPCHPHLTHDNMSKIIQEIKDAL